MLTLKLLGITEILEIFTPPTDEDASYHDQLQALYDYYLSHLLEGSDILSPEELFAHPTAWTNCFPKEIFQDDFDLPVTSGRQI